MDNNCNNISGCNFEEEVLYTIASVIDVDNDEKIIVHPMINQNLRIIADMFLPKGCKYLNVKPNTIVEVHIQLYQDWLLRCVYRYLPYLNNNPYSHLLIIYKDSFVSIPDSIKKNTNIRIISKTELDEIIQNGPKYEEKKVKNDAAINNATVLERAKDIFKIGKNSLFIGAGLSMSMNVPGWRQLLNALLEQNNNVPFSYINQANSVAISNSLFNSSIIIGRYIIDGYRNAVRYNLYSSDSDFKMKSKSVQHEIVEENARNELLKRMRNVIYGNRILHSELLKSITKMIKTKCVQQIITYNYDDLLEEALNDDNNKYCSVYNGEIPRNRQIPIFHVHGMVPKNEDTPGLPILSEKEYHQLYNKMSHWTNVVQLNALYSTTCFFVGFSMSDPNQRRLLDIAKSMEFIDCESQPLPHFVFLQKRNLDGEAEQKVNDEHINALEKMMNGFGLNVIWYESFDQLPKLINYISGVTDKTKV